MSARVVGGTPIADLDTHTTARREVAGGTRARPGGAAPLHLRPLPVALVVLGGMLGAGARQVLEQAMPAGPKGFPAATLVINLSGAFALGALLEGLVRSGDDAGWRRGARLGLGTGFCGGFTTYSTLAMESVQLARHGAWSTGAVYVLVSAIGGLVAAASGIGLMAGRRGWRSR